MIDADEIATVAVAVVIAATAVYLFLAALTAVFSVAGWHLPWS